MSSQGLVEAEPASPHRSVVAGDLGAAADDPLLALFQDDRLVTRANVESDRLLGPGTPDHVLAVVRVTVRAQEMTMGTFGAIE